MIMKKVILIGLDGATFDIINPMIKKGKLPTFNYLLKNGSYGILESTIPPVTLPAWPCMYTGKRPEKLEIFGFMDFKRSYEGDPINSRMIRENSDTIFDILSRNDIRIASINVPSTYPPWKVNGFMVSGLMTPSSKTENSTYPPLFKKKLDEITDGYEIHEDWGKGFKENHMLKSIRDVGRKHFKVVMSLINEVDFLFYVFRATDLISHIYLVKKKSEVEKIYEDADRYLSKIIKKMRKDDVLIVVSDHGFREIKKSFYVNKWLESLGFLKRKVIPLNLKAKLKSYFGKFLKNFPQLRKFILKNLPENIKNIFPDDDVPFQIDWGKTMAYASPPVGVYGRIYINIKHKKPKGIVSEKEYFKLRKHICKELKKIKDGRKPIIENIWTKEELYGNSDEAPDIIFSMRRPFMCRYSFNVKNMIKNTEVGEHDLNGIFIAYGKGIKSGFEIKNAKIYDITPTILHIFNLPIPRNMDGKVLEIFENNSEYSKRNPVFVENSLLSEREKIRKKIKELKLKGKI